MESKETSLGKKPYKFVPLTESIEREKFTHHNEYSKNTFSGKIDITIKTLTPIHIGQGTYEIKGGKAVKSFIKRNGKLVIPGSSIKGMLRSIYEAITPSCTPKLPNSFRPLEAALPNKKEDVCTGGDEQLCPSCSVFGTTNGVFGYKCKLRISEFNIYSILKNNTEDISLPNFQQPFKPYPNNNKLKIFVDYYNKKGKRDYGNERLYYADFFGKNEGKYDGFTKGEYFRKVEEQGIHRPIKFRGRKFYLHNVNYQEQGNSKGCILYEMVKKDVEFNGSINFENLTERELSALCVALGIGSSYKFKIGYGKPAYFGSIEIKVNNVVDYKQRYTGKSTISMELLEEMANKYKYGCNSDIKVALEKLEDILSNTASGPKWPNKCY